MNMGPLVNPVQAGGPPDAVPGLPPGGPDMSAWGHGEPDMGGIEEALPATGYNPFTGQGYVPPGGVPQAPAPLPQGAGLADTSGGVKPTDWLKDEYKRQNPDSDSSDADIIRWAASTGTPNTEGGWEGGPKAGVELEDVSKTAPTGDQFGGALPGEPEGEPEDGGDEGLLFDEDKRNVIPTRPPPGADRRPPPPQEQPPWQPPPQQQPPWQQPQPQQPAGPGLFEQMTAGSDAPIGSPFASGYDPNAMPTTAAQFTESGDQATADMLNRINTPPTVQNYIPQQGRPPTQMPPPPWITRQEGGLIESAGEDEIPNRVLEIVSEAVRNGDTQTVMEFKEAVVPDVFSEQEFDEFLMQIQSQPMERQAGGIIPGNGDAMADNIITTADPGTPSEQDVAISSGEYVVAGDVVSGLGSGNTDRGAEVLDQLQDDVRIDRTGSPQQPPPIDLSQVLPGTYGDQYA